MTRRLTALFVLILSMAGLATPGAFATPAPTIAATAPTPC
jgi:hypothetical protein